VEVSRLLRETAVACESSHHLRRYERAESQCDQSTHCAQCDQALEPGAEIGVTHCAKRCHVSVPDEFRFRQTKHGRECSFILGFLFDRACCLCKSAPVAAVTRLLLGCCCCVAGDPAGATEPCETDVEVLLLSRACYGTVNGVQTGARRASVWAAVPPAHQTALHRLLQTRLSDRC
jgi:hypothetical protein